MTDSIYANTEHPFFQALIDVLPGRVCIIDKELKAVGFNNSFAQMMYANQQVQVQLGETIYDKVTKENQAYWEPLLRNALEGKDYQELVTMVNPEGIGYARITLTHLANDTGAVSGVLVQLTDITEERLKDLNLTAFRLLASHLPNTDVFLCDSQLNIMIADGGEMRKYGSSNESFEGRNLFDLAKDYGLEMLIPHYYKAVQGLSTEISYEYQGDYYKVQLFPVIEDHTIKNIILVSHNITELKQSNLKLQQINDSKDSILGIVAHDLRSPITAILGIAEHIKDHPDKLNEFVKLVEASGHSALSVISDLLDISELGKEDYILPKEGVHLNTFIYDVMYSNHVLAESKGIKLKFEPFSENLYTRLNIDKFSRVLNNLLSNAIKFSHPKQTVTISAELRKKKVLIKVADEGIGIPAAMQEYIFDKLTRAGRSGTAGERSIGLGMSIVKQIVLLHGGTIWIESEEGKGTAVFIELDAGA